MSSVVSLRIDDEKIDEIRKMGHKPSEYLSMILEAQLRLERSKGSLEWFKRNRFKTKGVTGKDMIRRDRDSR
jgi:hypothetical protein